MKAIAMLLCLGLVAPAFANEVPSQAEIMPVLGEVDGKTFPVVAKKDGDYFPVFMKKGGQPYFADASGETHFVYNTQTQSGYDVYVEKDGDFVELSAASKNDKAELKFAKGDESVTQPVCFGWRRWYRARYYRRAWSCYPRYYGGYYGYTNNYYGYGYGYSSYRYGYSSYNSYYRPYYGWGAVIY